MFYTRLLFLTVWACCLGSRLAVAQSSSLPRPDHVVIVFFEDRDYKKVIGNPKLPYLNELAKRGALFTNSRAITRPSLPNYLAFFSGSTQGLKKNTCGGKYDKPNLGSELLRVGLTFVGYAESLPFVGYTGCATGLYPKNHNAWVRFINLPSEVNRPFTDFPRDFTQLPTLAIAVPNERHSMEEGNVTIADDWLRENFSAYIEWTFAHNSLFILSFDEGRGRNQIATIFVGPMVQPGEYAERINHYSVLRTLLDMYGLTPMEKAVSAQPITNVWTSAAVADNPASNKIIQYCCPADDF